MPFNVHEGIGSFDSFAHQGNFMAQITPPQQVGDFGDLIRLRCDSIDIPGRNVATSPLKYYGPPQEIGYEAIYPEITATFILSEDLYEKQFFQRWQDFIIGPSRSTDQLYAGIFNIGYYSDYIGTINIYQYSVTGEITYTCQLQEAYPYSVTPLSMTWDSDSIMKQSVAFKYRYYRDDIGYDQNVLDFIQSKFSITDTHEEPGLKDLL